MAQMHENTLPSGLDALQPNIVLVIEISCGVVLLTILGILVLLFYRIVSKHRRLIADLEKRGIAFRNPPVAEVPTSKPGGWKRVLRKKKLNSGTIGPGWDSLTSIQSKPGENEVVGKSNSVPLFQQSVLAETSQSFLGRNVAIQCSPVGDFRTPRLSAIIESPLSGQTPKSPQLSTNEMQATMRMEKHETKVHAPMPTYPTLENSATICRVFSADQLQTSDHISDFSALDVGLKMNASVRRSSRSKSEAQITANPTSDTLSTQKTGHHLRPPHKRSISLCSQSASIAPKRPATSPARNNTTHKYGAALKFQIERIPSELSLTSFESIGSSILGRNNSPNGPRASNAKLKRGANHEWEKSLIPVSQQFRKQLSLTSHHRPQTSQASIRSNTARFSSDSITSACISPTISLNSHPNLNSPSTKDDTSNEILTGAPTSIVFPNKDGTKVPRLRTPQNDNRAKVHFNGSPVERNEPSHRMLGDTESTPTRQPSQSSSNQDGSSTHSSNGNPFQFETSPMMATKPQKPRQSALKGSPNARKGHRRQSCVRLALQPTILGPRMRTPSQSSIIDVDDYPPEMVPPLRLNSPIQALGRQGDIASVYPEAREGHGSNRADITPRTSPLALHPVRRSLASSEVSIPKFPSPCRAMRADIAPPPTFVFSRPSNEFITENLSNIPSIDVFAHPITPAQLGIIAKNHPISTENEIQPRLLFQELDAIEQPHSPEISIQSPATTPDQEAAFETVDTKFQAVLSSRQATGSVCSPPCSPKSLQGIAIPPNLSVSRVDEVIEDSPLDLTMSLCTESFSTTSDNTAAGATMDISNALSLKDIDTPNEAEDVQDGLEQKIQGPRIQPPKPIRDSVMKLRRMNSDVKPTFRADRRYLRLGREGSPTLTGEDSSPELFIWDTLNIESASGSERSTLCIPQIDRKSPLSAIEPSRLDPPQEVNESLDQQIQQATSTLREESAIRTSSVWEDGEKFWEVMASQADDEEKENWEMLGQRQPRRRSHMRKSAILNASIIAHTGKNAPRIAVANMERWQDVRYGKNSESLYDQDGFLKYS